MDKSEILVHISAPSGVIDDTRYRAQVEAILNFQYYSREIISLLPNQTDDCPSSSSRRSSETSQPRVPTGLLIPSHTTPCTSSARQISQQDSLASPVSVIPDSQPQIPAPTNNLESLQQLPLASPAPRDHSLSPPSILAPSPKRCRVTSPPQETTKYNQLDREQEPERQHHISPIDLAEQDPIQPKPDHQYLSLPMTIKAPLPPISTEKFVTHITPTLAMLASRLSSPRIYNPLKQTRELDKLERGYWHLPINLIGPKLASSPPNLEASNVSDKPQLNTVYHKTDDSGNDSSLTNSWDMTIFNHFWSFLTEFISKDGRAGWGVWCSLDGASPEKHNPNVDKPSTTQSVALKIYAWGEIARHIYLLLFLASERRIRTMGAQWRDGCDNVVIQMP